MSTLQDNLDEIKRQKDTYLIPTNIRTGVTIMGVEGNLEPDKPDQSKNCTPSTSSQIIRADTGYELAQVNVGAVTSAIDSNIVSGNIKSGVTILGIIGEYSGSVDENDLIAIHTLLTRVNNNDNTYTGVGDTYENYYEILNMIIHTEDIYTGAGGTDEQILANLNSILGIVS